MLMLVQFVIACFCGAAVVVEILASGSSSSSGTGLKRRLRSYDVLHHSDIETFHKRERRNVGEMGKPEQMKAIIEMRFSTSGRTFHLQLTKNTEIFAPGFVAEEIDANGKRKEFTLNADDFMVGVVSGEHNSKVFAHWESEALNAKIVTEDETFYIEPSWKHLSHSTNYSMISYKATDLIVDEHNPVYCAGVHANFSTDNPEMSTFSYKEVNTDNVAVHHSERRKRATEDSKNTCSLLLVIDHKFVNKATNGDKSRASNYIVDLVSRVDSIYRRTDFGEGFTSYGFQIEKVTVHSSYSGDDDAGHYNSERNTVSGEWDIPANSNPVNLLLDVRLNASGEIRELQLNITIDSENCPGVKSCSASRPICLIDEGCNEQDMLNAFGRKDTAIDEYGQFCLAHLFTAYSFSSGVLGLAYIASPLRSTYGGICSKDYYDPRKRESMYLNTGWSSALNKAGDKILTQEAEIVLAHELGHNWGSEHDPATAECSPSENGKFIMHPFSVSGFNPNNVRFSPCSQASVRQVLKSKSGSCFKEYVEYTQGNYRRDEGEECDEGKTGGLCCSSAMKYRESRYDCSESNDKCCGPDCTIAGSQGKECSSPSELNCQTTSWCDGKSSDCIIRFKSVGDSCLGGYGRCQNVGNTTDVNCLPFSQAVGLKVCFCTEEADLCALCHYKNGACVPFNFNTDYQELFENCEDPSPEYICAKRTKFRMRKYTTSNLNVNQTNQRINLRDSLCLNGYCDRNSVCQKESTDFVERFWSFLTQLNPDAAVEFMKDNIVGTIIIFSLILWIPCVIAVYCIDKKRKKRAAMEEQAFLSMRRRPNEEPRILLRRAQVQ